MLGRYQESVKIIEKALLEKGERFDWDGDFYQVNDGMISPNSYQQPRFPFWGGGQLPASIERCGVYAESYTCDDFPILPEVWAANTGAYRRKAEEHGKEPFIVLMRDGWVADSFEEAARPVRDALCERDALLLCAGHLGAAPAVRLTRENHGRSLRVNTSLSAHPNNAVNASSGTTRSSASTISRCASAW